MRDVVQAALRGDLKRLLVAEPTVQLAAFLAQRTDTTLLTVIHGSRRAARRSLQQIQSCTPSPAASYIVMRADLRSLPFETECFDSAILGRNPDDGGAEDTPLTVLGALRMTVRPQGLVMVISRLREGALGGVGSLVKRAGRQGALPKASDLTGWMLVAGMRKVRQTALPKALVPTALTWAEVKRRPWEK